MNKKCVLTDAPVLDDCHITVEFGYGSYKDLTTYTFSPVSDEVGRQVIECLDKLTNKNVEDFGKDMMDDTFGPKFNKQKLEDFDRQQKGEWGYNL